MNRPICLFDSGLGGLSVLKECLKTFPNEDYLYFADEKFCPYGNREDDFIIERVEKIVRFLNAFNPKTIIIGCNTASRFAKNAKKASKVPIIEIITPTVNYLKTATKIKKLLILATESTKNGGLYQSKFKEAGITCKVVDCGFIVRCVENFTIKKEDCENRLFKVFSEINLKNFDAVLYACTHFSFADQTIRKFLKGQLEVFTAERCAVEFIKKNNIITDLNDEKKKNPTKIKIFTNSDYLSLEKKLKYYGLQGDLFKITKTDV